MALRSVKRWAMIKVSKLIIKQQQKVCRYSSIAKADAGKGRKRPTTVTSATAAVIRAAHTTTWGRTMIRMMAST